MLILSCHRSVCLNSGCNLPWTESRSGLSSPRSQALRKCPLKWLHRCHLLCRLYKLNHTIDEFSQANQAWTGFVDGVEGCLSWHDLAFVHLSCQIDQDHLIELGEARYFLQWLIDCLDRWLCLRQAYCGLLAQRGGRIHPLMGQNFLSGISALRLTHHLSNEIKDVGRLILPLRSSEIKFSFFDLLEDLFVCLSIKRWIATEYDVKNDTSWPHIALLIVAALEHFRGNIERLDNTLSTVPALVFMAFFGTLLDVFLIGLDESDCIRGTGWTLSPWARNIFDKPKSISLRHFSSAFDMNKKFSGFRSLWHTPLLWQKYIALMICLNISLPSTSSKYLRSIMRSNSSPPSQILVRHWLLQN